MQIVQSDVNGGLLCHTHAKTSDTHVKMVQSMSEFSGL